uniref:DDE Tnp4 domain-containing protein n=1 Tax=Cucumis melo TaxID=3656 RepID=A0A9I9E857_CUCME
NDVSFFSIIFSYALQNCLGALDGTYIKVNIPASDRARYRTRKGEVATTNHPTAKGLLNKSFSHYNKLSYVFGKDRAMRGWAESFMDVTSNDLIGYEAFAIDAAPDTNFQLMYSQGLNMSPDELMGTRTARVSEGRYVLSGSKRKRGGQATDSGDVLRTTIEYGNEQLNRIAE